MKKSLIILSTFVIMFSMVFMPITSAHGDDNLTFKQHREEFRQNAEEQKAVLQNKASTFEEKKAALIALTDISIQELQLLIDHLEEQEGGVSEARDGAIAALNDLIASLEETIVNYEAAGTIEELREAHQDAKRHRGKKDELRDRLREVASDSILHKIEAIIKNNEHRLAEIQKKIDQFKEGGFDTTALEADFAAHKEYMDALIADFLELKAQGDVTREDVNILKEALKEAQDSFREVIKDAKDIVKEFYKELKDNEDDDGDDNEDDDGDDVDDDEDDDDEDDDDGDDDDGDDEDGDDDDGDDDDGDDDGDDDTDNSSSESSN